MPFQSHKKPVQPSEYVSTGSTLLNLAASGNGRNGFKKGTYVLFVGDSSTGKAQPLTSKILTSVGWKTMSSIKVGDTVVDPEGGYGIVTGIYPQGLKKTYCVQTTDGGKTECTEDHLWMIEQKALGGRRRGFKVKALADFKEGLINPSTGTFRVTIPITHPVDGRKTKLSLHPYLLGVLLGNGCLGPRQVSLTSSDAFIIEKIKGMLPKGINLIEHQLHNYCLSGTKKKENPISRELKKLGLFGTRASTKCIPEIYLEGCIEQRFALLQGLMDTDGYAPKQGNSAEYSTSSPKLASNVVSLVRSLGGVAFTRTKTPYYTYKGQRKQGQKSYLISIKLPPRFKPFSLPRKNKSFFGPSKPRRLYRTIEKVTPTGKKETQCISVSTKSGLYITDDYIVTHNTWFCLTCLAEAANNPEFDNYRLILDDVEYGSLMDIERYFGKKAKDRIEPPAHTGDHDDPKCSDSLEDAYDNIEEALNASKPCIYILDSMDVLEARDDQKKAEEDKKARKGGKEISGSYGMAKAKINSTRLRGIVNKLRKTGSILIIISQTRDNIGFGFETKTRAGGRALRFYAHLELWTSLNKKIKKKDNKSKKDREVGAYVDIQIKKNRYSGWLGKVQVPFLRGYGIDDVGSCLDFLVEEKAIPKLTNRAAEIRKIEESKKEQIALRKKVKATWKAIESSILPDRKPRYE